MALVFLSVLGVGDYKPVAYRSLEGEDEVRDPTPFISCW
jgi:hypothetical protein